MPKLTKQQEFENQERSNSGAYILGAYKLKNGLVHDDDHTNLIDLITDIRHLAHRQKDAEVGPLDFDDALRVSRTHFDAEVSGHD